MKSCQNISLCPASSGLSTRIHMLVAHRGDLGSRGQANRVLLFLQRIFTFLSTIRAVLLFQMQQIVHGCAKLWYCNSGQAIAKVIASPPPHRLPVVWCEPPLHPTIAAMQKSNRIVPWMEQEMVTQPLYSRCNSERLILAYVNHAKRLGTHTKALTSTSK